MIHKSIKKTLGFDPDEPDSMFLEKWKEMTSKARKPCWDLKYCPYGYLVEQFPLLPGSRSVAIIHNEYLKDCLKTGIYGNNVPLDEKRREFFQKLVNDFQPDDYPEYIPEEISEMNCSIFGHVCPVVFVAEEVAEDQTK